MSEMTSAAASRAPCAPRVVVDAIDGRKHLPSDGASTLSYIGGNGLCSTAARPVRVAAVVARDGVVALITTPKPKRRCPFHGEQVRRHDSSSRSTLRYANSLTLTLCRCKRECGVVVFVRKEPRRPSTKHGRQSLRWKQHPQRSSAPFFVDAVDVLWQRRDVLVIHVRGESQSLESSASPLDARCAIRRTI
jgi:hypothetical protein